PNDDDRHAERGGGDDRGLTRDELEIRGLEKARANQDAEDHGHKEQPKDRTAGASHDARHHAALPAPVAASISEGSSHSDPGRGPPRWPRRMTAMRSHKPSNSGR